MNEWQDWRNHPITKELLKRLDERIAFQREILIATGRDLHDVTQVGAETVAIINLIDGLEFVKYEIEMEIENGDTAG